jgi:hypothetical protein
MWMALSSRVFYDNESLLVQLSLYHEAVDREEANRRQTEKDCPSSSHHNIVFTL